MHLYGQITQCQSIQETKVICDMAMRFPVLTHNSHVLANSTVYHLAESGTLVPINTQTINGIEVPYFLVGDSAYPVRPWLMKPFRDNIDTSPARKNFNYHLSRVRIVIEMAFGKLKGSLEVSS